MGGASGPDLLDSRRDAAPTKDAAPLWEGPLGPIIVGGASGPDLFDSRRDAAPTKDVAPTGCS